MAVSRSLSQYKTVTAEESDASPDTAADSPQLLFSHLQKHEPVEVRSLENKQKKPNLGY